MNERSNDIAASRARRRGEARRREILQAASQVFRHSGFDAASMREIASAADLSPGNLYYYFKSKHEILYFCQDRTLDRLLAAVGAARTSGRSAAAQMDAVIRAHLQVQLDELEGATAHLEFDALPADLRARSVAKRDQYEQGIVNIIEAGIRRREFAACDAKLVTRAILGALNWTARWFNPRGRQSAAEVADAYAEFLVRGLASQAGTNQELATSGAQS